MTVGEAVIPKSGNLKPAGVKAIIAVEWAIAVAFVVRDALVFAIRTWPERFGGSHSDRAKHAFTKGSAIVLVFAAVEIGCAIGLQRRSRIAWWIGMLLHAALGALLCYDAFVEAAGTDASDYLLAFVPFVIAVFYLLPQVRRWVFPLSRSVRNPQMSV